MCYSQEGSLLSQGGPSHQGSETGRPGAVSRFGDVQINTYPSVEVVAAKLHRRVRHDAYAVRSVAAHEPSPPFVAPHLGKRLAHGHLVGVPAGTLHLE